MKKTDNLFLFFGMLLMISFLVSCEDNNLTGPATVSELKAYPGINRVKLEFDVPSDATHGKVFHGKGDFHEFLIDGDESKQTVIVEGLTEAEQVIRVVTFNADSITSEPKGVKVMIYGEKYQNGLTNRTLISQNTLSPTSIDMIFGDAKQDEVEVRILFKNTTGQNDSIVIPNNQKVITVNEIDLTEPYYYYTVYSPVAEPLDYFVTARLDAQVAAMMNFEKENWTIAGFSDETPGSDGKWGVAANIIDDNANSDWHSTITEMPHWITVDMQTEKLIDGFYFVQTQDFNITGLAKKFTFETSVDNENWTLAREGEFADNRFRQSYTLKGRVQARYFRITIFDGHGGAGTSQIAEIDLFNEGNSSGENGPREIPLINATKPFQGDGSDLFPAVGAGRMQRVEGWTHNENAYISRDNESFAIWSSAVWGIADVNNGKIYQTLELQPGNYTFNIDAGHTSNDDCTDVFGLIVAGDNLPDFSDVTTHTSVLGYSDLVANKESMNSISFTLDASTVVSLGIVYNTYNVFDTTGVPWSDFYINGFYLALIP